MKTCVRPAMMGVLVLATCLLPASTASCGAASDVSETRTTEPGAVVARIEIVLPIGITGVPSLDIGATMQLSVNAWNAAGGAVSGKIPKWISSSAAATVESSGLVHAVSGGTATITATVDGATASIALTVRPTTSPFGVLTVPWAGDNQSAITGTAITGAPAFWVVNLSNAGLPGVRVDFQVASGAGSLAATTTVTDRDGIATLPSWTVGAGVNKVTASVAGLPSPAITFTSYGVRAFVVQSIVAGTLNSCAIVADGTPYCWGGNEFGQLGNDSTSNFGRPTPGPLAGGIHFQSLAWSLGNSRACGLTSSGAAYCWGQNNFGELGNGASSGPRSRPTAVATSQVFSSIAGGFYHTCGTTTVGDVYCWGSNQNGTLGNSQQSNSPIPVRVNLTAKVSSLSVGAYHSCALTSAAEVYCWGWNNGGVIAVTGDAVSTPVKINTPVQFRSVVSGDSYSCGLVASGAVYCWGANAPGLGDRQDPSQPVLISTSVVFDQIVAGRNHMCGLTGAGDAYCWGVNSSGALGNGTPDAQAKPMLVAGGLRFRQLSAGDQHTCGVTTQGIAFCWGSNGVIRILSSAYGQLGDSTKANQETPTAVHWPWRE